MFNQELVLNFFKKKITDLPFGKIGIVSDDITLKEFFETNSWKEFQAVILGTAEVNGPIFAIDALKFAGGILGQESFKEKEHFPIVKFLKRLRPKNFLSKEALLKDVFYDFIRNKSYQSYFHDLESGEFFCITSSMFLEYLYKELRIFQISSPIRKVEDIIIEEEAILNQYEAYKGPFKRSIGYLLDEDPLLIDSQEDLSNAFNKITLSSRNSAIVVEYGTHVLGLLKIQDILAQNFKKRIHAPLKSLSFEENYLIMDKKVDFLTALHQMAGYKFKKDIIVVGDDIFPLGHFDSLSLLRPLYFYFKKQKVIS